MSAATAQSAAQSADKPEPEPEPEPVSRKNMLMAHARAIVAITQQFRDDLEDYVFDAGEMARLVNAAGDADDAAIDIAEIASGA